MNLTDIAIFNILHIILPSLSNLVYDTAYELNSNATLTLRDALKAIPKYSHIKHDHEGRKLSSCF